jgi:hypothetical protein
MAIVIFEERIENSPVTFEPEFRGVTLWITDGVTNYITQRGNLPLAGDLLPALLADEAQIWLDAVAGGLLATPKENAKADRLIWLAANPGAKAIFTLTSAALEAEIIALVDAIIPAATAANRTKLKRLLQGVTLVSRESVAGE